MSQPYNKISPTPPPPTHQISSDLGYKQIFPGGLRPHFVITILRQFWLPCGARNAVSLQRRSEAVRVRNSALFCFSWGANALGNFVIKTIWGGVGAKFCTFLLFIRREYPRQFRYKGDLRRWWCEILYFSAFHKARMPSAISLQWRSEAVLVRNSVLFCFS